MGTAPPPAPPPAAQPMAAELELPQSPWGVPESGSRLHAADRGSPARAPPSSSRAPTPAPTFGGRGEAVFPSAVPATGEETEADGASPTWATGSQGPQAVPQLAFLTEPLTTRSELRPPSLVPVFLGALPSCHPHPHLCTAVRSAPAPPGPPTDGFHLCGCPQPGWCGAGIWVGGPLVGPVAPGSREPCGGGGGSRVRAWVARVSHSVSTWGLGKLPRPVRSLSERR